MCMYRKLIGRGQDDKYVLEDTFFCIGRSYHNTYPPLKKLSSV